MAQVTKVKLLDDLDGSKAAETVSFGLDGTGYEIDLNVKNAKALRTALSVFVGAARRVKPSTLGLAARRSSRGRSTGPDAAAVRAWAHKVGVPVSVRGRVSAGVRDRYLAAAGR